MKIEKNLFPFLVSLFLISQTSLAGTTNEELLQLNELPVRDGQVISPLTTGAIAIEELEPQPRKQLDRAISKIMKCESLKEIIAVGGKAQKLNNAYRDHSMLGSLLGKTFTSLIDLEGDENSQNELKGLDGVSFQYRPNNGRTVKSTETGTGLIWLLRKGQTYKIHSLRVEEIYKWSEHRCYRDDTLYISVRIDRGDEPVRMRFPIEVDSPDKFKRFFENTLSFN
jgi:hypothetical protein